LTDNPKVKSSPVFSPDGKTIVFVRGDEGNSHVWEIYRMRADGSHQERLTHNRFEDTDPNFSPDGQEIAFSRWSDYGGWVYTMRPDGSHVHRLTGKDIEGNDPAYSPDGRKLVFQSARNSCIYKMNPDGSRIRRLTHNPGFEQYGTTQGSPVWGALPGVPP
jgi:Tol biopolymer transport system component